MEHPPEQRGRVLLEAVVDVERIRRVPRVDRGQPLARHVRRDHREISDLFGRRDDAGKREAPQERPLESDQKPYFHAPLLPQRFAVAHDLPHRARGGQWPAPAEPAKADEVLAEEQRERDGRRGHDARQRVASHRALGRQRQADQIDENQQNREGGRQQGHALMSSLPGVALPISDPCAVVPSAPRHSARRPSSTSRHRPATAARRLARNDER
jgi:hypothetical protein